MEHYDMNQNSWRNDDMVARFDGDTMAYLETEIGKDNLSDKVFWLNGAAVKDIESYTVELGEEAKLPGYFSENPVPEEVLSVIARDKMLFAEGGYSEEMDTTFPDTWIRLGMLPELEDTERERERERAILLGIFAEDMQYTIPVEGREVVLQKEEWA